MKVKFFIVLCVMMSLLASCGKKGDVEYMPCVVEEGDDWGFVDSKGNVYWDDEYKNQPTCVVEGVFAVEEGNAYNLYKFDKKKRPKTILEDLKYVGSPRNGLLPVTMKDSVIFVVDTKGNVKFKLSEDIVECEPYFVDGLLKVKSLGGKYGLVDEKGEKFLAAEYERIYVVNKNFIVAYKDSESEDVYVLNIKKEKNKNWKFEDIEGIQYLDEKYIAKTSTKHEDRIEIVDYNKNVIYTCKDNVKRIVSFNNDKTFIYYSDTWTCGVMDFEGNKIIKDGKYSSIMRVNKNYIVYDEDKERYKILNKKGEEIDEASDAVRRYDRIYYVNNFGLFSRENKKNDYEFYLLNGKYEHVNDEVSFVKISDNICLDNVIKSDYFDASGIVKLVVDAATSGKLDNVSLDKTIGEIPMLDKLSVDDFNRYTSSYKYLLEEGALYKINMTVKFDNDLLEAVYDDVEVTKYGYYGYHTYTYTETERRFDHYEINKESEIAELELEITIPSDKIEKVKKSLIAELKKAFDENTEIEGTYVFENDDYVCSVSAGRYGPIVVQIASNKFYGDVVEAEVEEVVAEEVVPTHRRP